MRKFLKQAMAIFLCMIMLYTYLPIDIGATENKNNSSYEFFDIGMTWDEAKSHCENLGGHLAVISSQEEQNIIENLISGGTKNFYWIGGYRDGKEWKTVTGEPFDLYTNWKMGEPNNSAQPDEEDKLQIFRKTSGNYIFGEWNDLSNSGNWSNNYFGKENCGFVCEWETSVAPEEKKAIIVIPGIVGSELWGLTPFEIYEKIWIGELASTIYGLNILECDEQGNSIPEYMISAPTPDKNSESFGTLGMYTELVKDLQRTYDSDFGGNGEYEVVFFAYDWRLPNTLAADALNKYIEDNGYSKVVFVAHSMGGIVASHYINSYDDSKVEKLITLGTPFYGAPKALNALENGKFLDINFLIGKALKNVDQKIIKSLGCNMAGIYELLPNKKYFDNNNYYVADYEFSLLSGKVYDGYDYFETESIIKSRTWYNEYLYSQFSNLQDSLEETYEKLRTQSIDTYTVVGFGTKTLTCLEYDKTGKGYTIEDLNITLKGDGTVPLISATMNDSLKANRIYYANGIKHSKLPEDGRIMQLVKNIINGNADNNYGSNNVLSYDYNCEGDIIRGDLLYNKVDELKGFSGYKIKVACPVEVTLTNKSGEFIGRFSPEGYDIIEKYYNDFYYCGENGETMIIFIDEEADISIAGIGDGTMDLEIEKIAEGEIERSIFYDDVLITPGIELSTTTDIGADSGISDLAEKVVKPTKMSCNKHSYDEQFCYDEIQHWHCCVLCNEKINMEKHDGVNECSICGFISENQSAELQKSTDSSNDKNVIIIAIVIGIAVLILVLVIMIMIIKKTSKKKFSN